MKLLSIAGFTLILTACGGEASLLQEPAMDTMEENHIEEEALTDGQYQIDTQNSSITWIGRKVVGEHRGNISLKSGELTIADGKLQSGNFVADMQSMTCTDIEDPKSNKGLIDHLLNNDFFSVENFPEATMVITSVETNGEKAIVTADFTIKGITNPITFEAMTDEEDGKLMAQGSLTFDRAKYDIRYGSSSFFDNLGNKAIHDEVELQFNLQTL